MGLTYKDKNIDLSRDPRVDYIKAFGIILMVAGHCEAPFTNWIYLFHMSLFFIVTGYCLKDTYSKNCNEVIRFSNRRIESLYIPCLIFNTVIVLLHNPMLSIGMIDGEWYSIQDLWIKLIKCVLFSGGESMSGAMWFLRTMFFSLIIYEIIECLLKKISKSYYEFWKNILFLGLLIINWMIPKSLPGFEYLNCTTVLILYQIGHMSKKYKIAPHPCLGVAGFMILFFMDFGDNISISLKSNAFYNPFVFLLCSIAGFCMTMVLADYIANSKKKLVEQALGYVGKHTLSIVMLHFVCFKFVTFIQILLYKKPIEMLKSYPCYMTNNGWWSIYLIVGIVVPLIIQNTICRIYRQIQAKIQYE